MLHPCRCRKRRGSKRSLMLGTMPTLPDPNYNETFGDSAVQQFCVYSSSDSEGRGGQPCNAADAADARNFIVVIDTDNLSSEHFGWNWGTGCQDIADTASTNYAGTVASAAAGDVANALLPGAGSIVSAFGNLITGLINHGAMVHNQENEILCDVVPRVADMLAAIVLSFRQGQMTASQAVALLNQLQSTTLQAMGPEAGRGSGQGVLRALAVDVGYFSQELPAEEQANMAQSAANPVAGAGAAVQNAAGELGLPAWALWGAGAALAWWLIS
jgi:hypothetical protein